MPQSSPCLPRYCLPSHLVPEWSTPSPVSRAALITRDQAQSLTTDGVADEVAPGTLVTNIATKALRDLIHPTGGFCGLPGMACLIEVDSSNSDTSSSTSVGAVPTKARRDAHHPTGGFCGLPGMACLFEVELTTLVKHVATKARRDPNHPTGGFCGLPGMACLIELTSVTSSELAKAQSTTVATKARRHRASHPTGGSCGLPGMACLTEIAEGDSAASTEPIASVTAVPDRISTSTSTANKSWITSIMLG